MRILFIGAGAVGSYIGGWLSSTNNDVTIIDPWPEQVNWVNKNGIEVSGPHHTFIAKPRMLHFHHYLSNSLLHHDPQIHELHIHHLRIYY